MDGSISRIDWLREPILYYRIKKKVFMKLCSWPTNHRGILAKLQTFRSLKTYLDYVLGTAVDVFL